MNVIILHADQLRYDGVGCCGNPHAVTPNIDMLAADSCVFDRHIVANPVCMPSRASLMTGLYPPGHNVWTNGVPLNRSEYVRRDTKYLGAESFREPATVAEVFAASGYDTALFGKLHLTPNIAPLEYGFQECWGNWARGDFDDWHGPYYGFRHVDNTCGHGEQPCLNGHYSLWLRKEHPDLFKRLSKGEKAAPSPIHKMKDLYPSLVPTELHYDNWLAGRFESYLEKERPKDKPFLAFIGFPDPHHPFTPSYDAASLFKDADVSTPNDSDNKGMSDSPSREIVQNSTVVSTLSEEERRIISRYTYAMVYQIDLAVGRIVSALKRNGMWDDTVIVFTSDHGDFLCDHGCLYKGLVGFDTLLHVPFIMRIPGSGLPRRVAAPMSNCDVMPTLASVAGVPLTGKIHGRDIIKAVNDGDATDAMAYCFDGDPAKTNITLYDKQYRMTYFPDSDFVELFNHTEDPGELRNIGKSGKGKKLAQDFKRIMGDRMLSHNNPILNRLGAW
ncbi:MAG: sulfatase-like hydrolase/transferase [Victivallales bacterium]